MRCSETVKETTTTNPTAATTALNMNLERKTPSEIYWEYVLHMLCIHSSVINLVVF